MSSLMRVYFYICCQNEQFDQGLVFILKKSDCILEYKYIFTEWKNVLLGKAPGFCYLIRLVLKMLEILIAILFMFNVLSPV